MKSAAIDYRKLQEERFVALVEDGVIDDVFGDRSVLIIGPLYETGAGTNMERIWRITGHEIAMRASYILSFTHQERERVRIVKNRDPSIFFAMKEMGYRIWSEDTDNPNGWPVYMDQCALRAFRVLIL